MRYWLIDLRKNANLSQYSLASKVGVTSVAICNIEHEKIRPSPELAQKLGDVLNFDWTRFYATCDRGGP